MTTKDVSPGKRILICDDQADIRMLIRLALEPGGYQIREAAAGREALEVLDEFRPDLFILDVMMPGMSGYEVCRAVRERSGQAVPIVFLTAANHEEDRATAASLGAAAFIPKPFSPRLLLADITRILESQAGV